MRYSLMSYNGFFWEPTTDCVGFPEWISSAAWKETEDSTEAIRQYVCTGCPEGQFSLCVVYVMSLWMSVIFRREHWSICGFDEQCMPVCRYIFSAHRTGWDYDDDQRVGEPVKAIVQFRLTGGI